MFMGDRSQKLAKSLVLLRTVVLFASIGLSACGQTFSANLYRREAIDSQPERWLIQAAGFRGQRSELFYLADWRVLKLAASSGRQSYQLSFTNPDGQLLFSVELPSDDSLVYVHPERLPAGEYTLLLQAPKKVDQLHIVLEFGY